MPDLRNEERHGTHCEKILWKLQNQPYVTLEELAAISKSHCRRITDLRQQGHVIDVEIVDFDAGVTHYTYRGYDPAYMRPKKIRKVTREEVIAHLVEAGATEAGHIYDEALLKTLGRS